jgi:hypothetical protein
VPPSPAMAFFFLWGVPFRPIVTILVFTVLPSWNSLCLSSRLESLFPGSSLSLLLPLFGEAHPPGISLVRKLLISRRHGDIDDQQPVPGVMLLPPECLLS